VTRMARQAVLADRDGVLERCIRGGEQEQAAFVASLTAHCSAPRAPRRGCTSCSSTRSPTIRAILGAARPARPPPSTGRRRRLGELQRVVAELSADDAEVVRVDLPDWLPPGGPAPGSWWCAHRHHLVECGGRLPAGCRRGCGSARGDPPRAAAPEVVAPGESASSASSWCARRRKPRRWGAGKRLADDPRGKWRFGEIASAAIAVGDAARSARG